MEIHLNNVPTNLLNPSETKDEPALGGLHTFYIEKMCEKNAPQNRTKKKGQYGYNILVKLHRIVSVNSRPIKEHAGLPFV